MSIADDMSLMAMQAANMSPASIARIMGWSPARAAKRLAELAPGAARLSRLAQAGAVVRPKPVEPIAERPIEAGVGLVLRTFMVWGGRQGAACLLGDGRQVFTVTGRARQDAGARIPVRQVEVGEVFPETRPSDPDQLAAYLAALAAIGWGSDGSCWVMVEGRADA